MAAFCRDQAKALARAVRTRIRRFGRWTPAPALPEGALTAPVSDAMALRLLVGPDRLEAWRDRLARAPFRAALLASATLHAAGFAGLMALHQIQDRDEAEPHISITIAPADPDARVGTRAGIDWGQPAEQGALSALLEARKGAALLSEIVISPPPPSRQPAARRSAAAPPAAPPRPKAAPREAPVDKPQEPPRGEPRPPAPAPAPSPTAVPVPVPEGRPTEPVPRPETSPDARPTRTPDRRLTAVATPPRPPSPAPARRAPTETPPSPPSQASSQPPSPAVPPQPATTQAAAAPAAAAPIPAGAMDKAYFDAVLARLVPLQNHPSLAHLARRHASGLVLIAFTIGRDGTVLDAAVRRSSGYSFLDKAGLDLIRLASPMPALPETLDKETLAIEIPIRFTYP